MSQTLDVDSLDVYISKLVAEYKMPGLAIGVIHDDAVLFKKGYGVTSLADPTPVSTQTAFPILSCTKAFTSACIGILVDEGKLQWDDKVIQYLQHFELSDPWITKEITISDLLSHRSGLRSYDGDLLWYGSTHTRIDIIEKIRHYPIKSSFRSGFSYHNVMYLVAGEIIAKASGVSWDHYVKERIFEPLAMNRSSTTLSALMNEPSFAHPHIAGRPIAPRSTDNIGPAGSINSNIDDMLHWLQLCLGEGEWAGKRIISRETFQTMTSPKTIIGDRSDGSYGFGWYIDREEQVKVLYHGGGMPGYKSMVALYPSHRIAIVVLTNKISMINEGLVNMISSYIAHPERTDWSDNRKYFTYFNYSWDNPPIINIDPAIPDNFSRYMGLYEDKVYGRAAIRMVGPDAIIELLPSRALLAGKLYFIDENRFKVKLKDEFLPVGEVVFAIDEDQSITGFQLDIPNDDFNFDNLHFIRIESGENQTRKSPQQNDR